MHPVDQEWGGLRPGCSRPVARAGWGAGAACQAKVFLSMSYVGNDWQAEASNMVKAMAAHPRWPTRSTCRCRSPV